MISIWVSVVWGEVKKSDVAVECCPAVCGAELSHNCVFWPSDPGDSCVTFPHIYETKGNAMDYNLNKIPAPKMEFQRN